MTITLPPNQQKWLEEQVAAGRFASVEEGVEAAILGLMLASDDDLAWAKPLVEQARASIMGGEGLPAESDKAELDPYLKSIGAR
jgi:antitoxin ParD1/3/4